MPEPEDEQSTDDTRRSFLKQGIKGALLLSYVTPAVESVFLSSAEADDDDDDGSSKSSSPSNSLPPSVIGNEPMPPPKKPNIDRVSPKSGFVGDVLTVYIWGHNFEYCPRVNFGSGISVKSLSYENEESLIVEIEIESYASVGKQDVTVINPNGESFEKNKAFEIEARQPPKIDGLNPDSGLQGSTVDVRIEGEDFQEDAQVSFGTGIVVLQTQYLDATEIRATIDISSNTNPGTRNVTVVNPDRQEDTKDNGFIIQAK
ncbi:MAG: hypothetical protein ACI8V2_003334 [Candidatus Latescibacterota bacterium]|jgi:hypothetical protein